MGQSQTCSRRPRPDVRTAVAKVIRIDLPPTGHSTARRPPRSIQSSGLPRRTTNGPPLAVPPGGPAHPATGRHAQSRGGAASSCAGTRSSRNPERRRAATATAPRNLAPRRARSSQHAVRPTTRWTLRWPWGCNWPHTRCSVVALLSVGGGVRTRGVASEDSASSANTAPNAIPPSRSTRRKPKPLRQPDQVPATVTVAGCDR
jgi:hypothetical protein